MAVTTVIRISRGKTCLARGRQVNQGSSFRFAKIKIPIRHPRTEYDNSEERFILEIEI